MELPDGEAVALEFVRGKPWLAFNDYLGDLQSRMAINLDLPNTALELVRLTIHESYPGHHAERCLKDRLLVRDRGLLEESIVLVPTPQSLVSEGIAELAPGFVLEADIGLDLGQRARGRACRGAAAVGRGERGTAAARPRRRRGRRCWRTFGAGG